MHKFATLFALFASLVVSAQAVTLVQTTDLGYYNNDIGTVLNLSNTGTDTAAEPFPNNNDSSVSYPTAPSLAAASSILGSWLTNPSSLNSHWDGPMAIPATWPIETEVGVIYRFNTSGATNVVARFGVDNGIYAWLDGSYIFGARAAGGVGLWEYTVNLADLSSGTHYLQLLLEDHGGVDGYAVQLTGTPAPRVPDSGMTSALFAFGLAALAWARRRIV